MTSNDTDLVKRLVSREPLRESAAVRGGLGDDYTGAFGSASGINNDTEAA